MQISVEIWNKKKSERKKEQRPSAVTMQTQHKGSTEPAEHFLQTNPPPNMAAANFVMAEGCGLNGTAFSAVSFDQ